MTLAMLHTKGKSACRGKGEWASRSLEVGEGSCRGAPVPFICNRTVGVKVSGHRLLSTADPKDGLF